MQERSSIVLVNASLSAEEFEQLQLVRLVDCFAFYPMLMALTPSAVGIPLRNRRYPQRIKTSDCGLWRVLVTVASRLSRSL